MDNVGIVVEDLAATIDFFRELGLELEGRATIEGEWAGRVTGLSDQRVEIAPPGPFDELVQRFHDVLVILRTRPGRKRDPWIAGRLDTWP